MGISIPIFVSDYVNKLVQELMKPNLIVEHKIHVGDNLLTNVSNVSKQNVDDRLSVLVCVSFKMY